MTTRPMKETYRYDIAFLRCLAILMVLFYHLQVPFFGSGFLGVDLFFVLSGYLMTQILSGDLKQQRFNLWGFYKRRMNRIFPVFFLVLITFFFVIWAFLGIKLYDYSRYAVSSALFVSNFYYYLQMGYFQPAAELNFLLHTWSLSIEIQFYVLFPLLLWLLFRYTGQHRGAIVWFLGGLALLSFLSSFVWRPEDSSFRFFMLHTRLWEFLAGSLAFLLRSAVSRQLMARTRNRLAGICMLLVVISPFLWHQGIQAAWPSAITLLPVLATAGQLLLFDGKRAYRWPSVRFLAERSYGMYLWHWPLIVIANYAGLFARVEIKIGIFLISLLLASGSYVLLEKKSRFFPSLRVAAVCILVTLCCYAGTRTKLYERILPENQFRLFHFLYDYRRTQTAEQYGFQKTHLQYREDMSVFDRGALQQLSDQDSNYLLIGDCHAGMFSQTIKALAAQGNVRLLQATMDETFPTPISASPFAGPDSLRRYLFNDYLPKNANRIDKVILMANYAGYSKMQLEGFLVANQEYFSKLGIPIVYIGQTDKYRIEYPVVEFMKQHYGIPVERFLRPIPVQANQFMKESSLVPDYVDVLECKDCVLSHNGQTYMYDQEHFSTFGTAQLSRTLQQALF